MNKTNIGFEDFHKRFVPTQTPTEESASARYTPEDGGVELKEWTRLNSEITELNRDIIEHVVPNSATAEKRLKELIARRNDIEHKKPLTH